MQVFAPGQQPKVVQPSDNTRGSPGAPQHQREQAEAAGASAPAAHRPRLMMVLNVLDLGS